MQKTVIYTDNAPKAIGTYSQAVKVDNTVYISGQIPLVPASGEMISDDFMAQVHQVFVNLQAVCRAAGGDLSDIVKLSIFMIDLSHFASVNTIMAEYFTEPYPARAAIQVSALPKQAQIEMDAIMVLSQ
jgi:reactive intermediate/imine deaminase